MILKLKCAVLLLLAGSIISGCASNLPEQIRKAPKQNPTTAEVRTNIARFINTEIRWGGVIASVENKNDETWIEIVARDLYSSGRPRQNDHSPGRFIASVQGFLDSEIYARDREVTVNGIISDTTNKTIGDYNYDYPVVSVNHLHLWEVLQKSRFHSYPGYYFDPWYYYYPWPHGYRHGYFRHHRYRY